MGINYFKRDDRDYKFLLNEHFNMEEIVKYEAFADYEADDFNMVIDESLKVGREMLGPANQDGDREGAVYNTDGTVTLPKSFHDAFGVMCENGWVSYANKMDFGGQGLPQSLSALVTEIFFGANMAFAMYTGFCSAAGRVIENYGTDEDKELFCTMLYSGEATGTMCLTEPDAGSDVGAARTKAVKDTSSDDDRIYFIDGVKRFISCGDHDMTENVIHLVLARVEGDPEGTKGLSLFIVPKIWVNPDGSLGEPNDVFTAGIEHKMGVHGSSTCTLNFGENGKCRGIILGEPRTGMPKMFQMMNEARLGCGMQALGLAASSYDTARIYAKERVQSAPFIDRRGSAVTIINHEDVRRMLMNGKAFSEAMRAMLFKIGYLVDIAENETDEEKAHAAEHLADLLLPVAKSYASDKGFEVIRDSMQSMGGVGYCSEFPVEQYARDMKIISIWEGTNYIQALDLIGRKMQLEGGKVFQNLLQGIMDFTSANKEDADFAPDFKTLFKATQAVGDIAMKFMGYFGDGRAQLIPLAATRFQDCLAEIILAQLMLEQGMIAREKLANVDPSSADGIFYTGKVATAKYFCRNFLPNVFGRYSSLVLEDDSAITIPEECF